MKLIKLPPQLSQLVKKIKGVGKHHYFIFTLALLAGLTAAVYVVDSTLASKADQTYYDQKLSESLKADFDSQTIKKIEILQRSNEHSAVAPDLPPGSRTNPFAE